jgi:hypothetical protein
LTPVGKPEIIEKSRNVITIPQVPKLSIDNGSI